MKAALPLRALQLPALAAVLLMAATPARADAPLWELGLGLGGLSLPHYRGSDQTHQVVLPVPYAIYRGTIFRATREGARAVLLDSDRFDVDFGVAASAPTRSKDNLARSGMPDLAPTVELGPTANVSLARGAGWKLDLRMPVHAVFTVQSRPQSLGWTASPVLNLDLEAAGWNLGLQAGPMWASRRVNAYVYDVAPAYATITRPAYAAEGGYAGWRWTTAASRRIGKAWIGAYLRGDSVGGARFEASPLVRQRQTLSAGLAVSWVFAVSDARVSIDD